MLNKNLKASSCFLAFPSESNPIQKYFWVFLTEKSPTYSNQKFAQPWQEFKDPPAKLTHQAEDRDIGDCAASTVWI